MGRGIGYRLGLARRRVPVLYGHVVTRIARGPDGLTATLARLEGRAAGEPRDFTADVVCLGYGFQPANELLRALGAAARLRPGPGASRHPPRRRLRDERARRLRRRRLLRARRGPGRRPRGDDRRPRGGRARSGSRGPRSRGAPGAGSPGSGGSRRPCGPCSPRPASSTSWRLRRHRHLPVRGGVPGAASRPPWPTARPSIAEVKQRTRAGMGLCQGRYCAPVLAALLGRAAGPAAGRARLLRAARCRPSPCPSADLARLGREAGDRREARRAGPPRSRRSTSP